MLLLPTEDDQMMVTVRDRVTGEQSTMKLNITMDEYRDWRNGAEIQDVMGHLSTEQREFLNSPFRGMPPENRGRTY